MSNGHVTPRRSVGQPILYHGLAGDDSCCRSKGRQRSGLFKGACQRQGNNMEGFLGDGEASLQDLSRRVVELEEFDPWVRP